MRGPDRALRLALLLAAFLLTAPPGAIPAAGEITGYRALVHPFRHADGTLGVAVRQFERAGSPRHLVLDPYRFVLQERTADLPAPAAADAEAWRQSPFHRALEALTSPPFPLANQGLRRAEGAAAGYFLTVDLCPSPRPLDRGLFRALAALPLPAPVPVTLMVSGRWLSRHPDEAAWLRQEAERGRLALTWGNHSLTHPYDPAAARERNFLLTPRSDLTAEVLGLERLLLVQGLSPSPFFRFPGLISDRPRVEALRALSLLPIGSDAWLAKGETARPGSVILVHGNSNEPAGVRRLLSLLTAEREAFRQGALALLPLRQAFGTP